jgi:hypothetical protein
MVFFGVDKMAFESEQVEGPPVRDDRVRKGCISDQPLSPCQVSSQS